MEERFIMTAFGKDRPGIVADVTQLIYECGCNLEDSTMTGLSDEFAIILLLCGEAQGLEEKLSAGCRRLEIEKGISAFLRAVSGRTEKKKQPIYTKSLHVEGLDQAGIVYKISRYLADNLINIANLSSRRTFSPESGAAMYTMEIQVQIPETMLLVDLENGLDKVADELHVEITL